MAEWNGLGRYPEDADVNDRPEEGTLLAYAVSYTHLRAHET